MDTPEKPHAHYHNPSGSPDVWSKEDNERIVEGWSHHEQKKLIRRVDLRLIPICGLLYCVSLLDRTNLSNATIAGMGEELNLVEVNGVDRYVCNRSRFIVLRVNAYQPAEHNYTGLLHHVHSVPAASHSSMPQDWTANFLIDNHFGLGYPHDWVRIRSELDAVGWPSGHSWHIGGMPSQIPSGV